MTRPRLRDTGMTVGELPPGPHNAITDVAGVRVGHTTLIAGQGVLRPGQGPVRTGVTAILPHGENLFRHKVRAAVHTINGFGKASGFGQVRELGVAETPIVLTNTLNVGLALPCGHRKRRRSHPQLAVPRRDGGWTGRPRATCFAGGGGRRSGAPVPARPVRLFPVGKYFAV